MTDRQSHTQPNRLDLNPYCHPNVSNYVAFITYLSTGATALEMGSDHDSTKLLEGVVSVRFVGAHGRLVDTAFTILDALLVFTLFLAYATN